MKLLTAALALVAASPAFAGNLPITLDFEGVTSFDGVGSLYAAQGITFTGDALGLANDDGLGPYFSNAPTAIGGMAPVGPDATMNVASGFEGAFGFFYSSTALITNAVQVWSGLDGSGSLLASFDLAANATAGGCSDTAYCNFNNLSAAFAGTGRSVTFGNAAFEVVFDNVTVSTVPEPGTALLMSAALAGLLISRRRAPR